MLLLLLMFTTKVMKTITVLHMSQWSCSNAPDSSM